MSPFIKDASVEAVLAAADIVDVVSGYTSLRKRGATHTGLCPFHQEKTPSFSVSADKGLYYCFGCGEGGNVFTFLQRLENLSFVETVEQLAERFSVELEFDDRGGPERDHSGEKRLFTLLERTAAFYSRFLWESREAEAARSYLEGRGLGRDICEEFRVGQAPAGWRGLYERVIKDGYTERELEDAGLLVRQPDRVYDRFRGRLMFPLVDHRGRVVGFGGRTLGDDTPKYLNSAEGPVYRKGHLLYGLYQARRAIADADSVLIVEGYTDVLALAQTGVKNVVASMGTALTENQIGLLSRFTRNVDFMFDADRAGTEAVSRSGQMARARSLHAMVVSPPPGKDPAEVAVEGGEPAVRRLLADRVSFLRFELTRALDTADTASAAGRVRAFEVVREILSRASSPKEREEEVRTVADRLRLSPENVDLLLRAERGGDRDMTGSGPRTGDSRARVVPMYRERVRSPEVTVEREFLLALLSNPEQAQPILGAVTPEYFVDPLHAEAFTGLKEALLDRQPGEAIRRLVRQDSDLGRLFIRLALESESEQHGTAFLNERHLRLEEQHVSRTLQDLRSRLESKDGDADIEARLVRLERLQHEIRVMLANVDEE
ncbi:MAG: DNA primase [Thermoleophilia bacterium]